MSGPYYEPGKYRARIIAQGFSESAEKKTPYFFLSIVPIAQVADDGEYPCTAEYERQIVRYMTDKTIDWLLDDLESLGWMGGSFAEINPDSQGYHSFRDQEIVALCEHEENNDKTYERWSLFREAKVVTQLPPTAIQKLDSLFGRELKARQRAVAPQTTAAAESTATVDNTDIAEEVAATGDDIPF